MRKFSRRIPQAGGRIQIFCMSGHPARQTVGKAGLRTERCRGFTQSSVLAPQSFLPPATSVAGLPVLMAHDQDSNAAFKISIYDRVRENLQRECSSSSRRWRSKAGMFNQELGDTFKFFEKTFGDHGASLFAVKIQSVGNIMLRSRVERVGHR